MPTCSLPTGGRGVIRWLAALVAVLAVGVAAPAQPGDTAQLERLQQAFERLIEQVTPSVVGIRVHRRYVSLPGDQRAAGAGYEHVIVVNGSGTILTSDGLILTNEHVIQSAQQIEVLFADGAKSAAVVVAADPRGDLAVIRAARTGLKPAPLAEWGKVRRGQWALALGNPYGLGRDGNLSVSIGVISNLDRTLPGLGEIDDRFYGDLIQTTAMIYPGCSGGPLFNIHGELVGVVTAMHTRAADDEGVGFAIPISPARLRVIRNLMAGRPIVYGYLGVTVRSLEPPEQEQAGLPPRKGVIVEKVDPQGPAAAVIAPGDVILRVGDRAIDRPATLAQVVGLTPPGNRVTIVLRRGRSDQTCEVTIGKREVSRVGWMRGEAILWRGLRLANLGAALRSRFDVDEQVSGVVVIDIADHGRIGQSGIRVGDVIERLADEPVSDVTAFAAAARQHSGPVEVTIRGRGKVTIKP